MRIKDYQTGKELTDVRLVLNEEELSDLALYVQKLSHDHHVSRAHLTEFIGPCPVSELTVEIEPRTCAKIAS